MHESPQNDRLVRPGLTGGGLEGTGDWGIAGRPTLYKAYGNSYRYRTELAFDGHTVPVQSHDLRTPPNTVGPAEITVVYDAGPWHERRHEPGEERHNALMADGHATRQNGAQYVRGLFFPLE